VTVDNTGNHSAQVSLGTSGTYVFPTTFAQQRLWFLEQLQPGSVSYLVPWSLRLSGKLNVEALENSLNEIVRRHEILRTTFSWKDGIPVQVVAGSLSISLPILDLTAASNSAEDIQRMSREEAHKPLDLERGPLVRARLLRLGPEEHVLLLTMHHIIFDGWSRRILVRELAAHYEAFCSGRARQLASPKLQYADYAVWQRKQFQGAYLEKQVSYWKEQLAGIPASLDLPTDHPRPAIQTFNGAKLPVALSPVLTRKLNEYSRERGVTLFMTLLAGFQALLARYSNQDDIVVGSPIANRNRAEIEEMIGFFANTLVLRTKFSAGVSFNELLAQVKETALGAYAHQDVPFEKLVEELQPERNLGQNPLFQVLFSFQNMPRQAFELAGLKVSFLDHGEATAKFDISAFLAETPDGVRGRIEYNTDLFDEATVRRMTNHYGALLESAVKSPELPLSQLPILSEKEHRQILVEWNATEAEYPRDSRLHDLVEQQAQRTPRALAVTMGDQQITYQQLNQRGNQFAHYLQKRGVGPETLVGIFLDRSIEMVVALLGVLKAGGAYVPLDPAYPSDRIGFILQDANIPLLITQQSLLPVLPASPATIIDINAAQEHISTESQSSPRTEAVQDGLAYVLYTSGSTGKPKGVQITHQNVVNFLFSMQREPGLRASDSLLAVTTLSFDIAGLELYLPLITGAKIVLASRAEAADGRRLLDLMQRRKPTVMQATPATWRMLIEAGWKGSPKLKILCGGEALPGDLTAQLLPRCAELWNMYGPTETTIWSSVYRVQSSAATASIGKPIANTTFYVLDSHMQPVPTGVAGELYIGGEGVARGYFCRPELTAQKFVDDPFAATTGARLYRTGDLAKYLPDGNVQYLGRTDFQVKIRGFRIELGEIESVLAKHTAVQQAIVAAREDSPGDKRLVAYVVTKTGQHLNITEGRAYLKQTLPDYMLPSALVELDALPLTPNGKVDRKGLPKPDFQPATSVVIVPARDATEAKVLQAWKAILSTEAIGVTDNFFDLGGHSLMAVRLLDEIKKLTGVEIPLTALFQGATVEHLAGIVRGTTTVPQTVVQQIQAGGEKPPFFAAVLAGVNPLGYVPLAKYLGQEQPFYTLQTPGPGPHATKRPYSQQEYEQVAKDYIRAMREIQPNGPYYIGGTCEGARIAFEMTRILESLGQEVNLLAIIDTWVLENTQNRKLWKIYYYSVRLRQFWAQSWRSKGQAVHRAARNRMQWWLKKSAPRKTEWTETYWPGEDFVPVQLKSRITIFKIPKQPYYYNADPLLGWGTRTISGVDIQIIPHGRHRLLLREPYVRELATAMLLSLKRVQAEGGRVLTRDVQQEQSSGVAVVSQ
jgi:amino acid adenylation domain-containing protein